MSKGFVDEFAVREWADKEWKSNADVRLEFKNQYAAWVSYCVNEARGAVKIYSTNVRSVVAKGPWAGAPDGSDR